METKRGTELPDITYTETFKIHVHKLGVHMQRHSDCLKNMKCLIQKFRVI